MSYVGPKIPVGASNQPLSADLDSESGSFDGKSTFDRLRGEAPSPQLQSPSPGVFPEAGIYGGNPQLALSENVNDFDTSVRGITPSVYILDYFSSHYINLNRSDTFGDIPHGELVALTYEKMTDNLATRIDRSNLHDDNAGIFALSKRVAADHPDGSYKNVIINLSWGGADSLSSSAKEALGDLIEKGATVYAAAGNAGPPNALTAIEGVIAVGAFDGLVGLPPSNNPIPEFVSNAEIDVSANGIIKATPVGSVDTGLVGFDINQDGTVDIAASKLTVTAQNSELKNKVDEFSGRQLAGNTITGKSLAAYWDAIATQYQSGGVQPPNPTDNKVISLQELLAIEQIKAEPAANRIKVPPGTDPDSIFVSARDASNFPTPLVYFEVNTLGNLQPLSDLGKGIEIRGTSFAAPNAAAADVRNSINREDQNWNWSQFNNLPR